MANKLTIDQIINSAIKIALGEVGYQRNTKTRWNKYAAEIYPTVNNQPYCGIGLAWVYYKAGADLRNLVWLPYVPSIVAFAKKIGAWKTSGQKNGDWVVFDWTGNGTADHVAIAYPDNKSTGYRSIEFNTSTGSTGSQSNGGKVAIRYRGRKSIMGWVDVRKVLAYAGFSNTVAKAPVAKKPVVDASKKTSGGVPVTGKLDARTAKEIQARLGVTVDGKIGPATLKAWQRQEKAGIVDGYLSGQSQLAINSCPAIWKSLMKKGNNGSKMVKKVQKDLGFKTQDGKLGPETNKALQRRLNSDENYLKK